MRKEIVLGAGLASFLLLIISLSLLLADRFQVAACGCPKMVSHHFVGLFMFLSIVFVAGLFYYLFSLKIESKQRAIKGNIDILFSILDEDEKSVIKKIVNNNGSIKQSELSKTYGKLKTHRIVKKLKEKNIVIVNKNGKNNLIELKPVLKQELIK